MEIQGTIIERTDVQHKTQTFSLQEFFLDSSNERQNEPFGTIPKWAACEGEV